VFIDSCSASHEIPASWELRVEHSIRELTPLVPIISQLNLLHLLTTLVVCDEFNIILKCMTRTVFSRGMLLSHIYIKDFVLISHKLIDPIRSSHLTLQTLQWTYKAVPVLN
jgi:hypothetical protein